jgi:hypothetical protein
MCVLPLCLCILFYSLYCHVSTSECKCFCYAGYPPLLTLLPSSIFRMCVYCTWLSSIAQSAVILFSGCEHVCCDWLFYITHSGAIPQFQLVNVPVLGCPPLLTLLPSLNLQNVSASAVLGCPPMLSLLLSLISSNSAMPGCLLLYPLMLLIHR